MTQQYLIGQLSALLEELQPPSGEFVVAVHDLRREVECSAVQMLPGLVHEAIRVGDVICREALECGDREGFRCYAKAAAAIGEFADTAGLTHE